MNEKQMIAAQRVFSLIDIWDRDETKTDAEQITDIYNSISVNPEETINFLLDIIENLQA